MSNKNSFIDNATLEKCIITDEQSKTLNKGICPTCGAINLKDKQIEGMVFKSCTCGKIWILRFSTV